MSTTAIKAGEAFYRIFAKDETDAGFKTAEERFKAFAAGVRAAGAAMVGFAAMTGAAFAAALKVFADFGGMIDDFSQRTGVSTDWAQIFKVSAELAGASLQDVENAFRRMQKTLAKTGKLQGMKPEEQFLAIADAIAAIEDPTQRAAAAMEIFGKSGTMLLPMLEEIRKTSSFLRSNGLMLSNDDIQTAAKLGDAFDMMRLSISQTVKIIAAALAPTVIKLLDITTSAAIAVAAFANSHRFLIQVAAISVGVIGAVGFAMLALSAASSVATFAMGGLTVLGTIWSGVATVAAGATWLLNVALGALLSPIGLAIAAVLALVVAVPLLGLVLSDLATHGKVFEWLSGQFYALAVDAGVAMTAISQAISAGDWGNAMQIAMAALNKAFQEAIYQGKMAWIAFKDWFMNEIVFKISGAFISMLKLAQTGLEAAGQGSDQLNAIISTLEQMQNVAKVGSDAIKRDDSKDAEVPRNVASTVFAALVNKAAREAKDFEVPEPRKFDLSGLLKGIATPAQIGSETGAVGATSSAVVARILQQTPVNTFEQKQVDLLERIAEATENFEADKFE